MSRLTRSEIDTLIDDLTVAHPIYTPQLRALRDQSLSQEAVRDALEEAAKVADKHAKECGEKGLMPICFAHAATAIAIRALKREPNAAGQDRVAGDDQQCLSSGATSRSTPSGESPAPAASIIALLGEARGYLEGLELAERIDAALASSGPAPAAPDVAGMVKRLNQETIEARSLGHHYTAELLREAAALLAKLGQGWIPVSEKLPGFGITCLFVNDGAIEKGVRAPSGWVADDDIDGRPTLAVTHWMSLPIVPGASDE